MKPPAADPSLVEKIVIANRILYKIGVVDGFGHVSARHDKSPRHFLLARNMAPGLVKREDILSFDLDGYALDADGKHVYLERFIHGEIYRVRPDVQAVVHSHSPNVIPFGVTAQQLQPVFHMSGFLGEGSALFDIRDVAGDTNLLVSNGELGAALAACLGARSTVLMRGHGSTVVGGSVEQAVYRAYYAEVNARLQMQAKLLGAVKYLSAQEAAKAAAANDTQLARVWELWRQEIGSID
jgi:HCOMODA/2-hydroxy-3-carboxy-muconic semialdehyde decarboxylase